MEAYLEARTLFDFKLDSYWREVSDKRALRRSKRSKGREVTSDDYVATFPPTYKGPELVPALAKKWAAFQKAKEDKREPTPTRELPGLDDFLAAALHHYDFRPERIPEREFKARYAREALDLGLSKQQVVRVYALETSGLGTADMVAGIHPIRRTGKPISSAIGYAQLLTANTTDELVKYGPKFIERLEQMARNASEAARRSALTEKAAKLRRMLAAARSIPHRWDRHVAFAKTSRGQGIHAINIDGDIGPWLQVVKLEGLKSTAARAGIDRLKGNEIELMNLAGPATGLEMMRPAGRNAPTPNFFERNAYGRNTIVRGKTASELLAALDQRMDENMSNPGAVEFEAVFDEVAAGRRAGR